MNGEYWHNGVVALISQLTSSLRPLIGRLCLHQHCMYISPSSLSVHGTYILSLVRLLQSPDHLMIFRIIPNLKFSVSLNQDKN